MKKINELENEKQYIECAELIYNNLNNATEFNRQYLNKYLIDLKVIMYPKLLIEIDDMMTRYKYYSSKDLIEKSLIFFPNNDDLNAKLETCIKNTSDNLVNYSLPVEHLSFRPLVSDINYKFGQDDYSVSAEDLLITSQEFLKILDQLYSKNYILIDINSLVDDNGLKQSLLIPKGKKPLIITIEGLNYYASRRRTGNSQQLIIDSTGKIASTYYNENGDLISDRNGEAIGILEQFIDKHPDFSFDGVKGNISLTGSECIFGYITSEEQIINRKAAFKEHLTESFNITNQEMINNQKIVQKIVDILKTNGWNFSSSSYENIAVGNASLENLKSDTKKWDEQVGVFTGKAKVYIFPYGSSVFSNDTKVDYLVNNGYKILSGIGPNAYNIYFDKYLFMDRIAINGYIMRTTNLSRLFDVSKVYSDRRTNLLK